MNKKILYFDIDGVIVVSLQYAFSKYYNTI